MALNQFFLQGSTAEQGLVQDLVNEQLRMYGIECHYIPRKLVTSKTIMREVIESRFDEAFPLEAYMANTDGYAGSSDILTKFGVRSTDEATFIISYQQWGPLLQLLQLVDCPQMAHYQNLQRNHRLHI